MILRDLRTPLLCAVLFLFFPLVYGNAAEIRILHVNDFHGFAEPYQPFGSKEFLGGISFLAHRVGQLRGEKPTLLLAAGDMIQGNNWANLSQGESVIELMNLIGFDAMALGNHEFDFGQEVLKKRVSEASFPVLGANVIGMEGLKPYVIKELGGLRVAVIGVVTEDTPVSTSPKNVKGLQFLSPFSVVERYVRELRERADLVIVLSHIGFSVDRSLAENVKGIDVIVGGHSHTRIAKPARIGETLIVQAWEHGKALGVLDLDVRDGKLAAWEGQLVEIRPSQGSEDPKVQSLVAGYSRKISSVMDITIGETLVELDGENVRRKETNLGDLVADILREVSGADAAIINGGGIRAGIKQGEIKVKDIYTVLPFDNYVVSIKLTGEQIRQALEHGLSGIEELEGRFPQVSGLKVTYSRTAHRGARIRSILIGGRPIDPSREYQVATNDFMAAGGDGYRAFGEAILSSKDYEVVGGMMKGEKLAFSDSGRWIRDVVIGSIRERKKVFPGVEGRIVEVD